MNDNEFWYSVWKIAGVVIVAIVLLGVGSCQLSKQKVVDMVKAGANPIEVACAYDLMDNAVADPVCFTLRPTGLPL